MKCPIIKKCGGCFYPQDQYQEELKEKTLFIEKEIKKTKLKIDVKPTILNLIGINDKFSLGEDIFSGKNYAFLKGIGYITKDNYYINGKYFKREDNTGIEPDDNLIKLMIKMKDEMFLSDTIIKKFD